MVAQAAMEEKPSRPLAEWPESDPRLNLDASEQDAPSGCEIS
jgi:hypothetical protein